MVAQPMVLMFPTRQKGAAMLMALFLTMIIALIIPTIIQRSVFQHANAYRESRFITALHAAEAGIEQAVWHLSYDKEKLWTGWNTSDPDLYIHPTTVLKDADNQPIGEVRISIQDPIPLGSNINLGGAGTYYPFPITSHSEPTITAVAGVPTIDSPGSEVRQVQVLAKARTTFSLGLFSDDDLELGGTTVVNSYDSRKGHYNTVTNVSNNGDSGSNGNVRLNGTPIIDGDASAGGSVVLIGQNSEITGEVEGGMTQIDLPSVSDAVEKAKLVNNNAEIPQAVKPNGQLVNAYNAGNKSLSIQAGATLTLPGGTKENPKVYYLSSALLNGNSKLVVNDYVVIFTDGSLDFSGGTVINNGGAGPPEKFLVYSSGNMDTDIKVNGGAGFAGAIYAPNAEISFSGGGHIFGAAVGGKVNVSGNAQFHYDEALGETGLIAYFEVREWVEKPSPGLAYAGP